MSVSAWDMVRCEMAAEIYYNTEVEVVVGPAERRRLATTGDASDGRWVVPSAPSHLAHTVVSVAAGLPAARMRGIAPAEGNVVRRPSVMATLAEFPWVWAPLLGSLLLELLESLRECAETAPGYASGLKERTVLHHVARGLLAHACCAALDGVLPRSAYDDSDPEIGSVLAFFVGEEEEAVRVVWRRRSADEPGTPEPIDGPSAQADSTPFARSLLELRKDYGEPPPR